MLPRLDLQFARFGTPALSVEFDVNHFGATSGALGKALTIPIRDVSHARPKGALISGVIGWRGEYVGIPIPAQPLMNVQMLTVPVTDEDLARIEASRAGENPDFLINLSALVLTDETTDVATGNGTGTTLMVPRETWLAVLDRAGFGKRRLIELPAAPEKAAWPEAVAQLHEASRRLRSGDAGGSLASSRVATERLMEAIGVAVEVPREGKPVRNYAEELASALQKRHVDRSADLFVVLAKSIELLYALFGVTSETSHKGLQRNDRQSAELAVTILTGLYLSALQTLG